MSRSQKRSSILIRESAHKVGPEESIRIFERAPVFGDNATEMTGRIDKEKRVIREAVIFAPESRDGLLYSQNQAYDPSFLDAAVPVLEGAQCFPGHPRLLSDGSMEERNPLDALSIWKNVKKSGTRLIGDVHFMDTTKGRDAFSIVESSWKHFGFSICGAGIGYRKNGVPIVTKFDPEVSLKPSIDLVRQGGAVTNIFESAPSRGRQPQENHMDPKDQKPEEKKDGAQTLTLTPDQINAISAQVRESIKPELDSVKQVSDEHARQTLRIKINEALATHKLDPKFATESLISAMAIAPADKWEGMIKEHKTLLGSLHNPVKDMGGDRDQTANQKIELGHARGLHTVIREMAPAGFSKDTDKAVSFTRKWNDTFGNRLMDNSDKTPETRALRVKIAEQFARVGIKNLFEYAYDTRLMTEGDVQVALRETTPIQSSAYSTLMATNLASVMIENVQSLGTPVSEALLTPYQTNKDTENVPGFDEPLDPVLTAENAEKSQTTLANKYVTLQSVSKYARSVVVTREAIFYDRTAMLLEQCNRIAQNAVHLREEHRIKGIFDWPSFRCYYPGGTLTTLWTSVNTEESNALADYTDIEKALQRLLRFVDSNSRRIRGNANRPLEVLLGAELMITAEKIFGAQLFETAPGTDAGAPNIRFANTYMNTRLYPSEVVDSISSTTWMLAPAGGFKKQFLNKIIFPLEIVPIPASEVQSVLYDRVTGVAVEFAEKVHARNNVHVVRNVAGALS